ncbi:Molybdopterin synthase sulfur carrier subunit [Vibrio nigripulchritudo SFn27]|uniref:Molybdopterin synthase sulfur carrier subunit n=3 Tax=Vibrionaceae TaxID=641 RepID=U4JW23_9VIBR|nr:Molybdopterin synthase sulfur carrier subunit [Vibrio nigripulchritudo AM115]CCN43079.1 Molybdopterin synthase sulfur carrier subunit [Vibrio nigripulchritudo FTn2]CCN67541.1 Molybdopterin synthase sulfur carrier subunit [Vibrio nigripulchritudo POn4]CCN82839.1 Molybdopterin synthase sulfur carrier subunit [Vibrio nigripulchritudo BLFn1]CCN90047.1 Molybdopterin synthase sulfur carrier subunit [Vibrio nigripulchritudo SFn27]CCN97199.1 Molybdopterin synthase sulfur carrier subunit [Vibrio nig
MMIKVLFFAQTRELVGVDQIEVDSSYETAEQLRLHLVEKGDKWALALEAGKLLVAINQTLSPLDSPIQSGDEVAFFPPVTGG